jgi:hypothetical protein
MMCSCSPTEITFVISLDQTCDDNDIAANAGIGGSFCFTETDVALPAPPAPATNATAANATSDTATAAVAAEEPVRSLQTATTTDPVVEVVSVQYLEFDTAGDLTVINQDDTYAAVSLVSGDRMKFASASSFLDTALPLESQMSAPALVPGGASLIIYGRTAAGVVVRNRFFWTYDVTNCGADNDPVKVDDEIGWVTVVSFSFFLFFRLSLSLSPCNFEFSRRGGVGREGGRHCVVPLGKRGSFLPHRLCLRSFRLFYLNSIPFYHIANDAHDDIPTSAKKHPITGRNI